KALGAAQVLVINGIEFEFWLPRLLASSAFKGQEIVATQGITPRRLTSDKRGHDHDQRHAGSADHGHHHGDFDPHAWQDLGNAVIYVRNIAQGLSSADPTNRAYYAQRALDYEAKITKLDQELKQAFSELPAADRKVITQHDAFGYF